MVNISNLINRVWLVNIPSPNNVNINIVLVILLKKVVFLINCRKRRVALVIVKPILIYHYFFGFYFEKIMISLYHLVQSIYLQLHIQSDHWHYVPATCGQYCGGG